MVTFHLEEVPNNGGRATSEVMLRDLDRRRWPSGAPIALGHLHCSESSPSLISVGGNGRVVSIANVYYRVLPSVTECGLVLPSVTECDLVLPSVSECYRVLPFTFSALTTGDVSKCHSPEDWAEKPH
jgi:hypothetical protein